MLFLRPGRFFLSRRAAVAGFAASCLASAALADPIWHPIAVFAGLDKITGRIMNFEVSIDETVQFGSLQVTPHVCNTRPPTEAPQTTSFVEVDEQGPAGNEAKRIFSGWMFAASPGLHGVEHPVYDVWLIDCRGGREIAVEAPESAAPPVPSPDTKKRGSRARRVEPVAPAPIEAAPIGPEEPVQGVVPADSASGEAAGHGAASDRTGAPKKKPRKPPRAPPGDTLPFPF